MNDQNKIIFSPDDSASKSQSVEDNAISRPSKLKMMIVDDDEDVHQVTSFVLKDFQYEGQGLDIINAYSGKEAIEKLEQFPDTAVMLLDVVMETNDAGLRVVALIRDELKNSIIRIILRTGQPGYAPEKEMITRYQINDYKNKTELTDQRLFTSITASLRSYTDLIIIESFRLSLEEKVEERTLQLRSKNKELTELNREKNEFLNIAAHDLKNPLSAIRGYAEIIRQSFDHISRDNVIDYAGIIESSSNRMFGLIRNLLDVNAIESGKMNLKTKKLDLAELVAEVITYYERCASDKKIEIKYVVPEESCRIIGDKDAVLQVLDNLLSNAIKYSPFEKIIDIGLFARDDAIECRIQDYGPGLSDDDKMKLFGKFARLTPEPTGDEHSTGLGLYIVRILVESMGGSIRCESTLGAGSTFIVELPSAENAAREEGDTRIILRKFLESP